MNVSPVHNETSVITGFTMEKSMMEKEKVYL